MLNGKNEIELDINAHAIRLIAIAVIFYNATLLSSIFEHNRSASFEKLAVIIRLSPVAWRHISFIGKYEFYNKETVINIQDAINILLNDVEFDYSGTSH